MKITPTRCSRSSAAGAPSVSIRPSAGPLARLAGAVLVSFVVLLTWTLPGISHAQTEEQAEADASSVSHVVGLSAGGSEFDATGSLDYRLRHENGWEIGLSAGSGWLRSGFIAGFAVEDGTVTRGALHASRVLHRAPGVQITGYLTPGFRAVRGAEGPALANDSLSDSNAVTLETGMLARFRVGPRAAMYTGVVLPFSLEIDPEIMNDVNGGLLTVGGTVAINDSVEGFAAVETGGIFGSDGDAGKYLTRATAGVRMVLGGEGAEARDERLAESQESQESQSSGAIGPFLAMEWRGMALADHLSHGPALQVGATLWRRVKVGVSLIQRPGPINPKTFDLDLPEGMTYRGQSSVALRSDGSVFGVFVSPMIDLPVVPVRLEVPITVGMAGFGFYLTGDDRDTPDGRRVSEWENELLMGQDSAFSIAVDVGVRAAYQTEAGWWQPFIGAHYTITPGYEAAMADDYGGVSVTAGMQMGAL